MITGILFDKDDTLYDFERSWSGFAGAMLLDLGAVPHQVIHGDIG